ncbi:MAG: class I SAM-dependent methyltransferase [Rubrobacter sp.]|nr:class I SAM-dependent methyltransferase [Rubrobacter sp.]
MSGAGSRDPLSPGEREELEEALISFCDRELDLLGDVRGLDVLYAGGSSLLWLEGLADRIGERGSLTALDADRERVEGSRELLREDPPPLPVRLVAGDVFRPPFEKGSFDLVYSAGLFHELDVRERGAEEALAALVSVLRPGGRLATSDFVDSGPGRPVQLVDEELDRELAWALSGRDLYGIGSTERLVALHRRALAEVRWRLLPPLEIRHLGTLVLDEPEPEELERLPAGEGERLRRWRAALRQRIRHEGYTRPATLYVEGMLRGATAPGAG